MFRAMPASKPDPFAYANSFDVFGQQLPLPSQTTPFDPQARRERDFAITVHTSPDAEQVAKVSRVARKAEVAPGLIEDQVDLALRGINIRDMTAVMRQFPVIGKFFENNPRAAVMAQDDSKSLRGIMQSITAPKDMLANWNSFRGGLNKAPQELVGVGGPTAGGMLNDLAWSISDGMEGLNSLVTKPINAALDPLYRAWGIDVAAQEKWQEKRRAGQKAETRAFFKNMAEANRPAYSNPTEEAVLRGLDSTVSSLMALATRNPNAAAGVFGAGVAAGSYQDMKAEGRNTGDAIRYALQQGIPEAVFERAPASALLEALVKRLPTGQTFAKFMAEELPGEMATTFVQSYSDWQMKNPGMGADEWVATLPGDMQQTMLGVLGGGTAQVVLAKTAERSATVAGKVVGRVADAQAAKADAARLEGVAKGVETSTLRTRDPDTFREAMKAVLDDAGTEHVYLPGEAAVAYFQSDAYDPDNDPMAEFYHEAFDAAASGGDVVLPADFALSVLPGTPAWDALHGDLRLTGGGMSANEASEIEASIDELMAEVDQRFDTMDAAMREMNDARTILVEKITAKLNNAGYTPYMARAQAEYIAQRSATRAARLGKTLTGDEFDAVDVNQVLPPELAKAKAADGTDLVINALRKGKDAEVYDGPSLLEWIAKRGGINDTGGDLKSMGLDKWHRGKVGRKKLLRKFDPAQGAFGGVSGAGDYGVDTTLRAAIEAGFFPELVGVGGEMGPSSLDTQVLLDAMADEMAGRPRYAGEPRVDNMRAAAEELRGLLADRGLDPDGMSDAELRSVIAQLDAASAGGFEQLPDVIEIDGVARPTRNSLGQPIAGSEEGVRNFYAWFGESKVVDEEGRPLVVYHGSGQAIDAFNTDGGRGKTFGTGAFFTSNSATASTYAVGASASVSPVYLAMSKPAVFDAKGANWNGIDKKAAVNLPVETVPDENEALIAELEGRDANQNAVKTLKAKKTTLGRLLPDEFQWGDEMFSTDDLARWSRKTGYESVIIQNVKDHGPSGMHSTDEARTPSTLYVAFSPTQIKSINNRGTYSPSDPRILFQSRSGVPNASADKGLPEALAADAKLLGDVTQTAAFKKKGLSGIDAPLRAVVVQRVLAVVDDLQIRKAVVAAIPVDVMDILTSRQITSEMLLDDPAMFTDLLSGDRNNPVSLPVKAASRVVRGVAGVATERLADEIRGPSGDGSSAPDAGFSDQGFNHNPNYYSNVGGETTPDIYNYQSYGDGPRGRIVFDTRRTVIDLFQARNNSTLIHELSHMWLEELRIDAELPDAPEQLKQDWQIVQDWFAANNVPVTDGIIPVEAHELFARAGERYAMEGKAPSPALTRLFETFRGWMVSIYKTVTALRAPITPEIRGVFDRLVATDEELNAMAEQQALEPLFKDAASIGMSEQEFAAYNSEVEAARTGAASGLLAKTMASVKARVTKEWNEQRRKLSEEAADALDQTPLYRALRALKSSPVNAQWIRDEMGADALDLLPRRVPPVYSDKGVHPDAIAEMAGYGSGREMIEALIGAEIQHRQAREGGDQRTMRERTIAQNVDEEMRRRHGDPFSDGSIEREALEAVHNEKQGEVFAAEARALARKTGQRVTPYKVAREWARRRVRQGTYAAEASPAAIQRHARNAAKAGTAAEKAMVAGKFDEALRFKQQQMLASAQLAEAKLANDEVEAARKRMDKIARRATSKTVDQDYLDQAHALLEAVDLRERSQKLVERAGRWEEWSNARAAEGFDIVVPPSFEAMIGKTNWSRLPVEQLLGLDAAVAQVMHLGRLKQTLLDNQERRDFEELVAEARAGAGNIDGPPPRDLMEPGFWDALKAKVAATDAALLKMETVFDWLDGGNSNGVFNRIVFRPIADAQGREQDMLKDYYGQVKALFEAVPGEITRRWGDTVTLPFINRETGLPERFRRQQLIAIALNTGNEGNLQRLTDGYGWNADALMEALNAELTAEEWALVQGVWDTIETLWPAIEAMEKRVNGLAPEKVEAREIVTPFGTFRGGYYPAIYDSTRNYRAEENRGKESDLFEGGYTRATTRSSATKNRLEKVTAPILLDLGVINRHLGEVIHDITHREAVMQANKFLTNERVMRLVDEALGPEIRKQFRPWVKFVANSWAIERAGNEGFGKWLGKLRANVTAVGMGLRATTVVTQISGYSNSIEVVGEKWVAPHLKDAVNPAAYRFVLEKSPEVRNRMDTLDRDIRTELARLSAANPVSKAARVVLDGRKFFFHGIGYMDRAVVVPTWLGAYNKALSEGMDDQDAVYAADKAVRVSQGAGAPKDMAAITRGTGKWGEALKLMTMFYSYFSAMYQRERTLGRDVLGSDQRRPRNVPRLAARAFWLLIVPPLLTEVLKAGLGGGDAPDDDEWWTQWVLRKLLANSIGPIPMARDVFEPAWNAARGGQAFTPAFSPVNRALSSFVDSARDVGKIARGDETTKATKHILETAGYATGLIPGQVASAAQFLVDVGDGDADPQGFADWVQGLSTGKIKED